MPFAISAKGFLKIHSQLVLFLQNLEQVNIENYKPLWRLKQPSAAKAWAKFIFVGHAEASILKFIFQVALSDHLKR